MCLIHYCTNGGLPVIQEDENSSCSSALSSPTYMLSIYIISKSIYVKCKYRYSIIKCILHSVCYDVFNYIHQIYK